MKTQKRIYTWFAGLTILLFAQASLASEATGSFSRNLTVNGSPQVEIQTGSGNITVRTGAANRVNIEARIKANDNSSWFGGRDSRLSAEERVKRLEANPPVQQNGNTIVIGKIDDDEL